MAEPENEDAVTAAVDAITERYGAGAARAHLEKLAARSPARRPFAQRRRSCAGQPHRSAVPWLTRSGVIDWISSRWMSPVFHDLHVTRVSSESELCRGGPGHDRDRAGGPRAWGGARSGRARRARRRAVGIDGRWWAGALTPHARLATRSAAAYAICAGVELSQLYHAPALDTIRATRAGHLVLGSGFDPRDLAAYALGVLGAAVFRSGSHHAVPAHACDHPTREWTLTVAYGDRSSFPGRAARARRATL